MVDWAAVESVTLDEAKCPQFFTGFLGVSFMSFLGALKVLNFDFIIPSKKGP